MNKMMINLILCVLLCAVEMMEMPDPGRDPLLSPGVITLKEDRSLLLTEVNWHLIRVQHLAPYKELVLNLTSTLERLEKIVSMGPRNHESLNRPMERKFIRAIQEGLVTQVRGAQGVLDKVRQDIIELLESIELYQGCHTGRVSRAVFSFMGLVMHDMFGVMDENGERLVRDLDASVKEVVHLQKSQASIVAGLLNSFQATSKRVGDIESKISELSVLIEREFEDLQHFLLLSNSLNLLEGRITELLWEVDTLGRIVGDAVQGRVSRQLVTDDVVEDIRNKTKFASSNLPAFMEVNQLYRCNDVIVFKVLVHIPTNHRWILYTPYPTPIPVDGHFFLINTPRHFAVPMRNTSAIIEFEAGQLEGCRRTIKEYICQAINLVIHSPEESCILNLISRDSVRINLIPSQCSISVTKSYKPFFHFMPNSEKIIYSVITNTSAKLTCGDKSSSHRVNGTGVLSIPASCTLRVDDVSLKSPRVISYPDDVLTIKQVDIGEIQYTLSQTLRSPMSHIGITTSLQEFKLHNKSKLIGDLQNILIKNQSRLMEAQEVLETNMNKYSDLFSRVGDHSIRDVSWLTSISSVVAILADIIPVALCVRVKYCSHGHYSHDLSMDHYVTERDVQKINRGSVMGSRVVESNV